MAKRYTDDERYTPKHMCEVCGRRAHVGADMLTKAGWLDTSKGWVCPGCPGPSDNTSQTPSNSSK